ncbi:hypothetical protein [Bizionia sp.]|uniref:hypothetical protein n=1 Tax=Bizionia sp. TaxID=1954480 RepID=UPI003A9423F1
MAKEIAQAVNWTVKILKNIKVILKQIYVMGHSAGGHLIALIATNPKYLENKNVLKGVI